MEKKKTIGIAVGIIIVLVVLLLFYRSHNIIENPYETREINMHLTVGNYTGINVDTSALFFGTVLPLGSSKRFVVVENIYDLEIEVKIILEGQLANWSVVSEDNFVLGVGENKSIEVVARAPSTAEYDNYVGKLILEFYEK